MVPQRLAAPALDQLMYLARTLHDGQLRSMVTLKRPLDAERMARAVRLSMDAEPVLGCRFVPHPWRPYWERRDDLERMPLLRIFEPPNIEEKIWEFLAEPLDPVKDLPVQAGLFRGASDTLAVKMSHEVTDGAGGLEYGLLIRKIYQELEANPAYRPISNPHLPRGQGQVFRSAGFRALIRGCLHFSFPHSRPAFPLGSGGNAERRFAIRRVEPQDLKRIKEYCRRRGVSINEVLMAAFYRALFEILDAPGEVALAVQVTANLRRYLPWDRPRALCGLSGVFFPAVKRKNFDRMAVEMHGLMEKAMSDGPWLGQALLLETAFLLPFALVKGVIGRAMARQLASGRVYPFFANLGLLGTALFESTESEVSDMAFFGPVPHPPGCFLVAYTVGGRLIISASFCHSHPGIQKSDGLVDLFMRELPIA